MIKNKLILMFSSALMLVGSAFVSNAQTSCKWTVSPFIIQPTCANQCNGSVSLTIQGAGGLILTYQWSNGATTANIFNLCEDEYTLTIIDDKGCTQTFVYSIEDPDPLVASCSVVSDETSPGAADGELTASATGGTVPYTYEWQTTPPVVSQNLTGLTAGTYFVIASDSNGCQASTFCVINTLKQDSCEGYRTQTQGGWGQCHQNGNNPGTYLFANFAGAFPNGLTLGCNNTLELTSAQGVCDFLPSGKKPKALPAGTIVDPGKTYRNVLAGQLVALIINVTFDAYDEGFSVADGDLGDQIILSGTFAGWTVYNFLDEANDFMGGCSSNYSASQFNSTASAINENYVDGNSDLGFLDCPDKKRSSTAAPQLDESPLRASVFPNPFSSNSNLEISVEKDDEILVELYSYMGQKIDEIYNGTISANDVMLINIEADNLSTGVYFARISSNGVVENIKLFIQK
jgi:type IX secretion system substrate protein/SprB-like repeat protein